MKFLNLKKYLIFPLILFASLILYYLPIGKVDVENLESNEASKVSRALILQVVEMSENVQEIKVVIEDSADAGRELVIYNDEALFSNPRDFKEGEKVLLTSTDGENFYIQDYYRSNALLWIFAIFVLLVIVVARGQGIGSLVAMLFSFLVLFKFVLPSIFAGMQPVVAAVLGSLLIIPAGFYSSHGFSRKTSVAVLATVATLLITGFLAMFFAKLSNLTGLASEEVSYLSLNVAQTIDFRGLLLAGMLISLLGILDDVTVSQASVVRELKRANPKLNFMQLYARAMRVGRDHISSLVNTLILVYTGAALPLLLVFIDYKESFSVIVNYEFMAEEIVRTLVGSVGLVLAVPVTTAFAAFVFGRMSLEALAADGDGAGTGSGACSHPH